MNTHVKKFANLVTIFGSTVMLGTLLMMGGCGDDHDHFYPPATQSVTTKITPANATLDTATGIVTTTTEITAKTIKGNIALTIPANTAITAKDLNGNTVKFTTLPIPIKVSTPTIGVSGMPNPITPGYIIGSTAGAVDITIGGMNTVTFSSPVTITIIVNLAKVTNRIINMNKNDGKGWINVGTATITGDVATFTATGFCWFGIDNVYKSASGSTGGNDGGTGIGF